MKAKFFAGLTIVLSLVLSACKVDSSGDIKGEKPKVVCTTTMLADMLKEIAGDKVEIKALMGPGVDPHEYAPQPSDREMLENADIVVYHGLNFEAKLSTIFEGMIKNKKRVINVSCELDLSSLLHMEEEGHGHHHHNEHHHTPNAKDPHVWNSPKIWMQCTNTLANKLSSYNSENKVFYMENAKNYSQELMDLDKKLESQYMEIPKNQRVLVTMHDAFGYLAHRYNFEVQSLQGITTAAEFSIKDVTDLGDYMINNNIKSMFLESSVPSKNLEAVINYCKDKGHEITIGGTLYSDALGDKGSDADSYVGMMQHNANLIVNALK